MNRNRYSTRILLLTVVSIVSQLVYSQGLEVGNFTSSQPYGITMLVNRGAAFVAAPQVDLGQSWCSEKDEALLPYPVLAPDGSYFNVSASWMGKRYYFTWGKLSETSVGAYLTADEEMDLPLRWIMPFSGCRTLYWKEGNDLVGNCVATHTSRITPIRVKAQPAFDTLDAHYGSTATTVCHLKPGQNTLLILTIDNAPAPAFEEIIPALTKAGDYYNKHKVQSEGDWGNFAGAIAKTMNASRMFSSLDRRIAQTIGRGWWIAHQHPIDEDDDLSPYFGWDSFFNALLSSLEDPEASKETVRAVLSNQFPNGNVSNYSHWRAGDMYSVPFRANPPVGSICMWRYYLHNPDKSFLREIYPNLVRWHNFFAVNRRHKGSYLLSWGSESGNINDARLETGYDDTQSFGDAEMDGTLLNIYNVDLCSLWAADAENLARIAKVLGYEGDANLFQLQRDSMVAEMNDKLWNERIGMYCNRFLADNPDGSARFVERLTPMNFYPLICGAPDAKRAKRVLSMAHNPKKFWGPYPMPTLPCDDPDFNRQSYWNGSLWAPASYLVWIGLERYDDKAHLAEYVRRNVNLFMKWWNTPEEMCCENYRSNTGDRGDHPHYTWGALLPLMAVEALVQVDTDGTVKPRDLGLKENIEMRGVLFGGKRYDVSCIKGKVSLTER